MATPTIQLSVSGGVLEIVQAPDGIEIIVDDYDDNERCVYQGTNFLGKSPILLGAKPLKEGK